VFSNNGATPIITILSIVSFVAGPLLCILAILFSVARRRKSRPLALAVIPLALTSVSIQLTATALKILSGFNAIAEEKIAGVAGVAWIFTGADSPLLWRFVEVAVCVAIASIIALRVRSQQVKELQSSVMPSLRTIAWSAAALVSVVALVWFHHDIVELSMLLLDPCRATEARTKLGNLAIADASAILSSRIVILAAAAPVVTFCLIGIGFHCLHVERRTEWGTLGSIVVAIVALAWCGMSVLAESRAQNYLQALGQGSGEAHQIYHNYFRSVIGNVLHSKGGIKIALPRAPDVQLPASVNAVGIPEAAREDAVTLTVLADGQLFIGPDYQVDMSNVSVAVKDRMFDRIDKTVYVRADAHASYGTVAQVFGQLRTAGVDVVGLLTSGRNPKSNSCATSGLEVLIPAPPLLAASDSAQQSQDSQFLRVLREPAIVPTGINLSDLIVVQVLRGSGRVRWKINQREVSGLNDLSAQLETILAQRPERVGFLMTDETLAFSDFIDAVDAGRGAGLDKVAVVIGTLN
jgi:biopolymer transport protein ExbD